MRVTILLGIVLLAIELCAGMAQAETMTLDQAVAMAVRANPQVRGARSRWDSASHQIIQNYTPADPVFTYFNTDSPRGLFYKASEHTIQVTESLQFPGKGVLQGRNAKRIAEIARLTYLATVRDVKAQAETSYYQIQLDLALSDLVAENIVNLDRVRRVTQIAYTASLATQGDFINAEFALDADQEQLRQLKVTLANDKTSLNVLLARRPDEPVEVERKFDLTTFELGLDEIVARAAQARQEILAAALTEKNEDTAVTLAKLEYAPDYQLGYFFDNYLLPTAGPSTTRTQDHSTFIGFNVPLFYWAKNEDINRARSDLDAAREDLASVQNQTAGNVTTLYRQLLRSRETALLYRDRLIPLARQAFAVMLVAYQGGKADFTTLLTAFRQESDARFTYLQAVNAFLANKVALEQAAGGTLQ